MPLLNTAPYSFGLKTVVFLILAAIMVGQKSLTSVGKWLVAFFSATTIMSASLTVLMIYLSGIARGNDINTAEEWFLVVTDAVWSLVVSVTGIGVMVSQRRVEQCDVAGDDKDERDLRQDARSEEQDERGEFQDMRGVEQSRENLRMDTRSDEQDAHEHRLDERDAEGDPQ